MWYQNYVQYGHIQLHFLKIYSLPVIADVEQKLVSLFTHLLEILASQRAAGLSLLLREKFPQATTYNFH